ncbi:MAG TPA: type II toxin-antitoxin system VapC family toxin [Tepidisphaeraceae bacterium]|jgi:predicted nucleic acid-binding protein
MGSIKDLIGKSVYLDANVFVYFLEGYPRLADLVALLFSEIDAGQVHGITRELTLAELLVKPIRDGNKQAIAEYGQIIRSRTLFDVVPISRPILVEAAHLRASSPTLKLPDAIHVATAAFAGCTALLTNDLRLDATGVPVWLLSELNS